MLELRLFGPGQARYNNRLLVGFPTQQCYLVFCYLLLNRQRLHHRERLSAVFWADHPTHMSRKYLRNELWRLRHGLQAVDMPADEYLSICESSVAFLTSSRYWLDIEVFESTIMQTLETPAEKWTPDQANQLELVVELHIGDLLEGVYADWCLVDRERLNLLHLNALSRLMDYYEISRNYERGLACGERILIHDDTRDKVHRQMMRLYWRLGNRNAALEQYKRCEQITREVLGVAPVEETRLLYQKILNDRSDPSTAPGLSNSAPDASAQVTDLSSQFAWMILQKLNQLETITAEASAELRHLERLIRKTLASDPHRKTP